MCLRLRDQCLRSKITLVARVQIVLFLRFVAGNVDVNTLASKRSELIGNAEILLMRRVIHNNSTCVCLRIPDAAITQKRKNASVDLWPALVTLVCTAKMADVRRQSLAYLVYDLDDHANRCVGGACVNPLQTQNKRPGRQSSVPQHRAHASRVRLLKYEISRIVITVFNTNLISVILPYDWKGA